MNTYVQIHIDASGPKKILCCDGGGIRGVASVEILAKIKADLHTQLNKNASFMLGNYFADVAN